MSVLLVELDAATGRPLPITPERWTEWFLEPQLDPIVPGEVRKLSAARRAVGEQSGGDVVLDRRELLVPEVVRPSATARERIERRELSKRDERCLAAEVLPGADEPLLG